MILFRSSGRRHLNGHKNLSKDSEIINLGSKQGSKVYFATVAPNNTPITVLVNPGDKVKVELRFRGRELGHKDIGKEVMLKFIDIVKEFGEPTKAPAFEGNNMVVMIDPKK